MSHGHWMVERVILGHNMAFNMDTLVTMWAAMAFLLLMAYLATKNISMIPNKLQLVFEKVLGYFDGLLGSMMPKESKKHFPLVMSLFLFILTANAMGQLPLKVFELKHGEIASPTNDINLTASLAIIVLVYYVGVGLVKKKEKLFLHEVSFAGFITMFVEILDLFTRPLTLSLRLFGNILAGEVLISAMLGICAWFTTLPFMFFELFVALIQAFVFTMLSAVYIANAVNEEH